MIGARPLTDKEISSILENGFNGYFKHRNRSLFTIGISTGFRISELLALDMRDVMHRKYPRQYIKVPRRYTKGKTQGRTMKLQPFAQNSLQPWIDKRLDDTDLADLLDEPVFISREKDTRTRKIKPITVSQAGKILAGAYERCNVTDSVTTHSMRKTFAKKAYMDAVRRFKNDEIMMEPLRVVQKQLGHKTIQSTLSYLSFIGSEINPDLFDFPTYS